MSYAFIAEEAEHQIKLRSCYVLGTNAEKIHFLMMTLSWHIKVKIKVEFLHNPAKRLKLSKIRRDLFMKYAGIADLKAEDFRRLTGVKRSTFAHMVEILKTAEQEKKRLGGKPCRLGMEDRLLMMLEYLREYRTYFHIATGYGISESSCYRTIRWIEDTLVKHSDFALPGRKALLKSDVEYEVVLVDASETPIQRPKKNSSITIQERKNGTR